MDMARYAALQKAKNSIILSKNKNQMGANEAHGEMKKVITEIEKMTGKSHGR